VYDEQQHTQVLWNDNPAHRSLLCLQPAEQQGCSCRVEAVHGGADDTLKVLCGMAVDTTIDLLLINCSSTLRCLMILAALATAHLHAAATTATVVSRSMQVVSCCLQILLGGQREQRGREHSQELQQAPQELQQQPTANRQQNR